MTMSIGVGWALPAARRKERCRVDVLAHRFLRGWQSFGGQCPPYTERFSPGRPLRFFSAFLCVIAPSRLCDRGFAARHSIHSV